MLRYYGRLLATLGGLAALLALLALPAELRRAGLALSQVGSLFTPCGLARWLLVDLLPGLLAGAAALGLASIFVAALYRLNHPRQALGHLWRCLFGQRGFGPWLRLAEGRFADDDEQHVLRRLGGPGTVLVSHDSAAVLARGGRLTRVLEPGTLAALEPFERVYDVLDVRPMRWEWRVRALSREGIPVTLAVDVKFQVDTDGRPPSDERPFPATAEAIFSASTGRWIRAHSRYAHEEAFDWARRVVLSDTEESVRQVVARYPLDALIDPDEMAAFARRQGRPPAAGAEAEAAALGAGPRQVLEAVLLDALRRLAGRLGVQVNELRLGAIHVDESVHAQWVEAWLSQRQYRALVERRAGEATREQQRELARAWAQIEMIRTVARAFEEATARDTRVPAQLVVMRLLEVFDQAPLGERTYLPDHALNTLERLRKLLG